MKELLVSDEPSNDSSPDKQQHEKFVDKEGLDKETTLANQDQENTPRKPLRTDAKQVVSSINIQLSTQSRKQTEEQRATSPSFEEGNLPHASDEKRLSYESARPSSESDRGTFESSRLHYDGGQLGSESGRLHYDGGRLGSESSRVHNENGETVSGGYLRKGQLKREPLSKNVFTSNPLKPLSPSRQISAPQKAEEAFRLHNAAQKFTSSPDVELPQKSELSVTGTRPTSNKDSMHSERTRTSDQFQQNMATKEIKTVKSFPLKVTDVDTGTPVAINENIGLTRQSHNPISDQLSIDMKNFPVAAKSDDHAKPVLVYGNGASGKSTEMAQALAQNDRRKKGRHVSLDPHAVLLDAAVEGELDLVKRVILEVRYFKITLW